MAPAPEDAGEEVEETGPKKKAKKVKPGSFQGLGLSPPVFKAIMRRLGCVSWEQGDCMLR